MLDKETAAAQIYRRDSRDLILLMRAKELDIDLTKRSKDVSKDTPSALEDKDVSEDIPNAPEDTSDALEDLPKDVSAGEGVENDAEPKKSEIKILKSVKFKEVKKPSKSDGDFYDEALSGVDGGELVDDNDSSIPVLGMSNEKDDIKDDTNEEEGSSDDSQSVSSTADTIVWDDEVPEDGVGALDNVEHDETEGKNVEYGCGKRRRPQKGYFRNMAFFLHLISCLGGAQSFDFGKKDRSIMELCHEVDYNYFAALFCCKEATSIHDKWVKNGLKFSIPDQVGLFQDLPLVEFVPPVNFNTALEKCAKKRGRIVEFDNEADYNLIKEWAQNHGYTCIVSHLRLQSGRPVWGSGDPYSFTWGRGPMGRAAINKLLAHPDFIGMVLWNLSNNHIDATDEQRILAHCATLCHLQEQPSFIAMRNFFNYARVQLQLLEELSPSLVTMTTMIEETYDITEDLYSVCVPIKIDLISPKNMYFKNMMPRETISGLSELEHQQQRFTKFIERYRGLHREMSTSISFWASQDKDLRMRMYYTGDSFRSKFKFFFYNLGFNLLTFLSAHGNDSCDNLEHDDDKENLQHDIQEGFLLQVLASKSQPEVSEEGKKIKKEGFCSQK